MTLSTTQISPSVHVVTDLTHTPHSGILPFLTLRELTTRYIVVRASHSETAYLLDTEALQALPYWTDYRDVDMDAAKLNLWTELVAESNERRAACDDLGDLFDETWPLRHRLNTPDGEAWGSNVAVLLEHLRS